MADRAPNRIGICLIGHSFISCLEQYLTFHPDLTNWRLYRKQYDVIIRACGGLRIASLANSKNLLTFEVTPDICFLQIGENDVLSINVDTIVRDIVALALYIRSGIGIRTVIIGQLLRCQPWASSPNFTNRIVTINVKLRTQMSSLDWVYLWQHRGL